MRRLHCPGQKGRPCWSLNVRVVQRECNHSKFNGSQWTPSAYSELTCLECGRRWRTKSKLVRRIEDITDADWAILDMNIGRSK